MPVGPFPESASRSDAAGTKVSFSICDVEKTPIELLPNPAT